MTAFLALALLLPAFHVHQEPRGIGNLVAPGDVVRITYSVEGAKSATGTLYVRNDTMRAFERLPLHGLSARVPSRLIRGQLLTYYAVVRDPKTGRTARSVRGSAWILSGAIRLQLGLHRFGHTRAPDATAAHWDADEVGWQTEGDAFGPETFLVGAGGSIWLDDGLNGRVLVSAPTGPRTVALPYGSNGDIALGPAGTVYAAGGEGRGLTYRRVLYRVGGAGDVLWKQRLFGDVGANSPLRFGTGGKLYNVVGMFGRPGNSFGWTPVATKAGQPVAETGQHAGTSWPYQPLVNGLRLVWDVYGALRDGPPREARYALFRGTRLVRAWRGLSKSDVNFNFFTPEIVGGDVVVAVDITKPTKAAFKWEYEILRLGPHGAVKRFALPRAVYGDNLLTDLRVGPDGSLYQLASSPDTGVTIVRYSLR